MAVACLLSACSKKDNPDDTAPVQQEWLLDHLVRNEDSVQLSYNTDGTIKKFARYSSNGGWDDSTQVEYAMGKISKFLLIDWEGGTRTDRAFVYSADQLVRIDYYNYVSGTEVEVTDHDSLVYENGKLAECHHINGTWRNSFSKFTWQNGDIVKEERFSMIGAEPVPDALIVYIYINDESGLPQYVNSNFLFLFSQNDYTYLSTHKLLTAETTYSPAEGPAIRRTLDYIYADGLLSKIETTEENLGEDETTVLTTRFALIKKN